MGTSASTGISTDFGTQGSAFWGLSAGSQRGAPLLALDAERGRYYGVDVGSAYDFTTQQTNSLLQVTALTRSGQPDVAFSADGQVVHEFPPGSFASLRAVGMHSGKLVVVVEVDYALRVLRFNADGTLDVDVPLTMPFNPATVYVTDAAVRGDGQIVVLVVGAESQEGEEPWGPAGVTALRFLSDGTYQNLRTFHDATDVALLAPVAANDSTLIASVVEQAEVDAASELDVAGQPRMVAYDIGPSLGSAGIFAAVKSLGPAASDEYPRALAADGDSVYWMHPDPDTDDGSLVIARWRDGAPDPAWQPYGPVQRALGAIALDDAGLLVAMVERIENKNRVVVLRLRNDGTLEPSFGTNGRLVLPDGSVPPFFALNDVSRPLADADAFLVGLGVRPDVAPSSVGSSTAFGYSQMWKVGPTAPTTSPPPVNDEVVMSSDSPLVAPTITRTETLVQAADRPIVRVPAKVSKLPTVKARQCISRRNFRVRLRKGKGNEKVEIRSIRVTVAGEPVRVTKREIRSGIVDLRGLPKGRFVVRADMRLANGLRVIDTRRYRTCVPKDKSAKKRKPAPVQVIG